MNYSLKELLDIPRLQELVVSLDQISTMPTAIVDIEGSILVDMVWQNICTKFHHMNPITKKICLQSDQQIEANLGERAETVYQCPLGLRHSIIPIIVEEKHLGNLLTSQHFSESPEEAFFIAQASQYGFNEDDYLEALRKVPFFSEETLHKNLNFIHSLTQMLAEQGLQNKRLQESRERRSIIIQTAICGFWLADMQGRLLEVNEAYCQMSGYSEQELLTMRIPDLEALERDEDTTDRILKIKETGQAHFESRHRRKDGTLLDVEVSVQYQPFDGGQCVAFIRDITERKLAEEELANSERFLKAIIDSEPECIKILDIDGNLLMMNRAGLNMIDADSFEQVKGQCVCPLITDQHWDAYKGLTKQVFEGIPGTIEYEAVGLKGRHIWLESHAVPFRNEKGEIVSLLGITRDITEQKRLEEERLLLEQQLQHTQKLESLGVLAGGIAHDFNNILAIIMGYCSLIKLDYQKAEKNIPIIEDAVERAAGLCRQMMTYAGKAQLTKIKINMVEKVGEVVGMLKATLPHNAVIKTDLSAEIPLIEGDASQLGQVVMNLIINSSEAIGTEQGEVEVSLASIKVIAGKAYEDYLGKPIPSGEYVCLEVTDNGCGMDEATKWRIFEPFYTTKFTGRGLGMSAVLGIIKSHAGALQLFSEPGQGTTFKVYLPAPANEVNGEENQIESAPPALWQGSGTILLVEDEDQIRDIAKEMLGIFGFSVLEAANGKEALEIYLQKGTEISLVLSDMGMPVMDGYELFHKLKSIDHELPIIVSSGYGDVEVTARIGSDNIAGIISKPYNPNQLQDVLKSVMDNN